MSKTTESTRAVRIPDDLVGRADAVMEVLRENPALCRGWRLSRASVIQVAVEIGLDEIELRAAAGRRI